MRPKHDCCNLNNLQIQYSYQQIWAISSKMFQAINKSELPHICSPAPPTPYFDYPVFR